MATAATGDVAAKGMLSLAGIINRTNKTRRGQMLQMPYLVHDPAASSLPKAPTIQHGPPRSQARPRTWTLHQFDLSTLPHDQGSSKSKFVGFPKVRTDRHGICLGILDYSKGSPIYLLGLGS